MNEELSKSHCYRYPRPALTVDVVLGTVREACLHILLIQRKQEPYRGGWALPGGFVEELEPLLHAACRELQEETGLVASGLLQCGAFGDPGRDPRGWTVSVAFAGLIREEHSHAQAQDDAQEACWFPISALPNLAFDHAKIIAKGLGSFRSQTLEHLANSKLLPVWFTWEEFCSLYQIIRGEPFNRAQLKRRLIQRGQLKQRSPDRGDDKAKVGGALWTMNVDVEIDGTSP